MEQTMKNLSNKEQNFELECEKISTQQKCHICDSHFENLDIHFLISHEPIGESNYKTPSIESEEIYELTDTKKETSDDSLEQTGL